MSTLGSLSESASKIDRISEDAIHRLVDGFYAKVRADAQLAPVFAHAIQDDQWEPHLAKMRDFWSSVMLTTGRYKGNPVAVHMAVAGMEPHLFGRWLELFGEACDELFARDIAGAFRAKAVRIADSLKLALYYSPASARPRRARGKGTHVQAQQESLSSNSNPPPPGGEVVLRSALRAKEDGWGRLGRCNTCMRLSHMTERLLDPSHAKLWRKKERDRLIAERLALTPDQRREHAERIAARLDELIHPVAGLTVSAYWPLHGEPDLRPWMERVIARGGRCALPVVVVKNSALIFRAWTPSAKMERGFWNIPVPADGAELVPDIVIVPVVGFDAQCYRLGYGGGYFDRTLAALKTSRGVIGVGYASARIATIHPQPHDIPMNAIVTDRETLTG